MNKFTIDVIGVWKGYGHLNQRNFNWESRARIRILKQDYQNIVVMSDLDEEDTGTSITNCSENLATLIKRDFRLTGKIIWFEHYPFSQTQERQAEIALVFYQWNGSRYLNTTWQHITQKSAEQIIGIPIGMENYQSLPIHRFKT